MNLQGWLPAKVAIREGCARVEWVLMNGRRLIEPFFEQTLRSHMAHPFHQLFRHNTSMTELVAWSQQHPAAPLRGLIFHISRCGSTLLSQQIAALECNIVASEPAPLDAILRAQQHLPDLSRDLQVSWLRAMAGALGQSRCGEQAFYIKMDCWHIHQFDLIRDAFPNVPWIFLYRNPYEVMASQQREPAAWTVPSLMNPTTLRLTLSDWEPAQVDVYRARALAHMCEAGLHAVRKDTHGLLVNYSELPQVTWQRLLPHFGLPMAGIPEMQKQSHRDAKAPFMPFSRSPQSAKTEATRRLRDVVDTHIQDVYLRLEAARRQQTTSQHNRIDPIPPVSERVSAGAAQCRPRDIRP